jgi:hypothetical protein
MVAASKGTYLESYSVFHRAVVADGLSRGALAAAVVVAEVVAEVVADEAVTGIIGKGRNSAWFSVSQFAALLALE